MAAERVGPIRRLLRLWRVYAYLDFMFMTRDLKSFLWYAVSDMLLSAAAVTTMLLLAERFDGIGAWTRAQVLFMLGYSVLAHGVAGIFFGYNILFISRRIGRGQFDHVLVQPHPLWMSLLTEGFVPFSSGSILLPGLLLLVWALAEGATPVAAAWPALFVLSILASAVISLAFAFIWSSLAFWAPSAAEEVSSSANRLLSQLTAFPLDGLGPALIGGLLTVVPAGLVAWYPVRALLGLDPNPVAVAVTPLAALLLGGLAAWMFRQGLREYARTGSSRYSPFGHRR